MVYEILAEFPNFCFNDVAHLVPSARVVKITGIWGSDPKIAKDFNNSPDIRCFVAKLHLL